MLRDFVHEITTEMHFVLKDFIVSLPMEDHAIAIVRFEIITPDSFIWRITIGQAVYYLYAEDYVSSLADLKNALDVYMQRADWKFMPVIKPRKLKEDASDTDIELNTYSTMSGYDRVFLIKTAEDYEDAYFSSTISPKVSV